ncbi:protein FD-like [Quercus lobata]|uniref:protein FD-like n=1 Tax=Quercus lobata TaxID=97700 RepID=UPI0012487283|nr:protein FD-like [Quercus lobata]
MWTSSGGNNHNSNNNRVTSSPSKSSTCSSPSPFSPSSPSIISTPQPRKCMEEVWKDIGLSSLHNHPNNNNNNNNKSLSHSTTSTTTSYRGMILQNFLAQPLNKDPPTRAPSSLPNDPSSAQKTLFLASLAPHPATILSLNSGSDFLETCTVPIRPNPQFQSHASTTVTATTPSFVSSLMSSTFDVLASSSVFPSYCNKRAQVNDDSPSDRRHKRMIKNRESAARSRARKQAYTNELELEVAHLQEENAKLRRQQEKLCLAASAQLPKKRGIYRTLTAPF